MLFFTALCIAIGAIYLFSRVSHPFPEIAVGCLAIALFGAVIALLSAPWQIHLALALVVILSYRSFNATA